MSKIGGGMDMINRRKVSGKLTLLLAVLIITVLMVPPVYAAGAGSMKSSAANILKSDYEKNGIKNNEMGVGSYALYVLTQAGIDTSSWKYKGVSLKESVINAINDDIANAGDRTGKLLAQDVAAAQELNRSDLVDKLIKILNDRQGENGFGNSVFSNVPAFELLGRAGLISKIDVSQAKDYILAQQNTTGNKDLYSWGFTYGEPLTYYPDFITATKAVRALHFLDPGKNDAAIQDAINKAINWMEKQQLSDGSFVPAGGWTGMDDPLVNTAEAIATLKELDMDLSAWKSGANKSGVDYLTDSAQNSDGSFGKYKNSMDALWFLDAYSLVDTSKTAEASIPLPTGQPAAEKLSPAAPIQVSMAVVDKNGETVISPFDFTVDNTNQWGLTLLGSLAASGIDYHTSNWSWGVYVDSIAGIPGGSGGWMYAINDQSGAVIGKCVDTCEVRKGDKILWYYANSMEDPPPLWSSLTKAAQANASGSKFNDINGHWAQKEIEFMAASGYVSGAGENRFSPDSLISRAEFVSILTRMAGLTVQADGKVQFSDVPSDAWYRSAVDAAVSNGIVNGIDKSSFAPGSPVTREQMAKMIEQLMAQKQMNATISDVDAGKVLSAIADSGDISSWAKVPVALMIKEELMKGRENNRFVPRGNASRAEATAVLYRVLQK